MEILRWIFRNCPAIFSHGQKLCLPIFIITFPGHLLCKISISFGKPYDSFHNDDHRLPGVILFHLLYIHLPQLIYILLALVYVKAIPFFNHFIVERRVIHGGLIGNAFCKDAYIYHRINLLI